MFCRADTIVCRDSTETAVFVFDRHSSEIIQSGPPWELCILHPSPASLPLQLPSVEVLLGMNMDKLFCEIVPRKMRASFVFGGDREFIRPTSMI